MSVLMYAGGAAVSLAGLILVIAGLPDKEFSFGNTLIIAGSISFVGGLIILALGAVVAQLQRLAEHRGADYALPRQPEMAEPAAREMPEAEMPEAETPRIPFPSRPKPRLFEPSAEVTPEPLEPPPLGRSESDERSFAPLPAPMMPNPVEPPQIDDSETREVPLSPHQPLNGGGRRAFEPPLPRFGQGSFGQAAQPADAPPEMPRPRPESWKPSADTGRPSAAVGDSRFFEAMWPGKPRSPSSHASPEPAPRAPEPPRMAEPMPEFPRSESVMRAPSPPPLPEPMDEPEFEAPSASAHSAVPVLRTGVVEGMAYTLFVDGSIEAELPTGKLHFTSINELRAHLANNTA